MIPIGNDTSKTYYPHCTQLHRCSDDTGCCELDSETCQPLRSEFIDLYIFVSTFSNQNKYMNKLVLNFIDYIFYWFNSFRLINWWSARKKNKLLKWYNLIIILNVIAYQNRHYQQIEYLELFKQQQNKRQQRFHLKRDVDVQITSWKLLNLGQYVDVIVHPSNKHPLNLFARNWKREKHIFQLRNAS